MSVRNTEVPHVDAWQDGALSRRQRLLAEIAQAIGFADVPVHDGRLCFRVPLEDYLAGCSNDDLHGLLFSARGACLRILRAKVALDSGEFVGCCDCACLKAFLDTEKLLARGAARGKGNVAGADGLADQLANPFFSARHGRDREGKPQCQFCQRFDEDGVLDSSFSVHRPPSASVVSDHAPPPATPTEDAQP